MATTAEYWVGDTLGEGSFGTVVYARHKTSKLDVAIKCIDKNSLKQSRHAAMSGRQVVQEQRILKLLKESEYIVKLYASFVDPECVYIVTELCACGNLQELLAQHAGQVPDPLGAAVAWRAQYLLQLVKGLQVIHQAHIVHCDIKPENILVASDGRIKISDFGSAVDLRGQFFECPRGTTAYSAPQVVKGLTSATCKPEIDLWSLACIGFAFWHGQSPFLMPSEPETVDRISAFYSKSDDRDARKKNLGFPNVVPDAWKDFVVDLLYTETGQTTKPVPLDDQYASLCQHAVLKGTVVDGSQSLIPPVSSCLQTPEADMKDGKDGWSVFLVN